MRRLGLILLLLVPLTATASVGTRVVSGYGISASTPPGWHARVSRGALAASTVPLPPARGSIGDALSHALRARDVAVLLYEDAPQRGVPFDRRAYRRGYPLPFSARDFGPPPLGGSNPGHHRFARRNFTVAGRYFDLFVESGRTWLTRGRLAPLNAFVRSIRVRSGDFYPGQAPPAIFRPARGWFTVHSRTVPVGPSTSSVTIASTVPYRDCLLCFPPHRTVSRLRADGVIVNLTLAADDRFPPTAARKATALRLHAKSCGSFEGSPPDVTTCPVHGDVPSRYAIDGWVVFGRAHPTRRQLARARVELGRLRLPSWPRWPGA